MRDTASSPLDRLTTALAGRYAIQRELGPGGMSIVYLAHDVRHDRDVAVKALRPEVAATVGAERFLREIRIAARLQHPHILPLLDSGETDGVLYYVMPYVEGEALRGRLDRQSRLSVAEAMAIAREVGAALDYAHRHGVIHRDIKPENILLHDGSALIADFGIAHQVVADGADRMTLAGTAVGTPRYMSPEQAAADFDIDGRSDEYSLACVVYEMLTGEPPFAGPTVESTLLQRFTHPPPRASRKVPGLPRSIDAALVIAMARDPSDRYATMAQFVAALTVPARARAPNGSGDKSVAVLPFSNLSPDSENEYFADGMAEEIINALMQVPELRVAARTSAFSFKGKNDDPRTIGDALNVDSVLTGSVRRDGGRVRIAVQLIDVAEGFHLWSERYDREFTDIFAIQDEIATAIAKRLDVALSGAPHTPLVKPPTGSFEAYDLYLKGRAALRQRGAALFSAVHAFEQAIRLDPAFALALAGLAQALVLLNFWGLAPPSAVRAQALASAAKGLATADASAEVHIAAGLTAFALRYDREDAARAWQRACALDPTNPDAMVYRAIYDSCYARGDFDLALREIGEAIARDPQSAYVRAAQSVVLAYAGRLTQAIEAGTLAVDLEPDSFYAQWSLLHAHALRGDYDQVMERSLHLMPRFGRHTWLLGAISIAARRVGREAEAIAVYTELTGRTQLEYVQDTMFAVIALNAGHRAQAVSLLCRACAGREALFPAMALHHPALAPLRSSPEYEQILRDIGWLPNQPSSRRLES
ncbi:MAG TPA: protein kinase [Gemmatimonadaceae bacterium]|nr:protein kinase [Gemmatimonadaceae bacterium]